MPREGVFSKINTGAVHVSYGSDSGRQVSSPDDHLWHQNKPGVGNSMRRASSFENVTNNIEFAAGTRYRVYVKVSCASRGMCMSLNPYTRFL